jgi:hypothetical protein
MIDQKEVYQDIIRNIAITTLSEEAVENAVDEYLTDEPRAVQNILEYSSGETLDGALERGDGLSQRVCDLAREMMIEEIFACLEGNR